MPLVGAFNVANLLGVVGVIDRLRWPDAMRAVAALPDLVPPPGRMQRVPAATQPLVVVDYAHTPDALEQALRGRCGRSRVRAAGDCGCVFGCGGDRDPGKRPPMGEAASAAADVVVVTSDNPRSEDPRRHHRRRSSQASRRRRRS